MFFTAVRKQWTPKGAQKGWMHTFHTKPTQIKYLPLSIQQGQTQAGSACDRACEPVQEKKVEGKVLFISRAK